MSMAGVDPHVQCPVLSAAKVGMADTQSNNNRDFLANKIHTPKCDWSGMETLVGMHS